MQLPPGFQCSLSCEELKQVENEMAFLSSLYLLSRRVSGGEFNQLLDCCFETGEFIRLLFKETIDRRKALDSSV